MKGVRRSFKKGGATAAGSGRSGESGGRGGEDCGVKGPFTAAVKLLAARDRSEKEIKTALKKRGFADLEIDGTVKRLKDSGLIDDARFARNRAVSRAQNKLWGRVKIAVELKNKGVSDEAAQAALLAIDPEYETNAAKEALGKWLKKNGLCRITSRPDVLRASRHLLSRGFSFYIAGEAIKGSASTEINEDE